MQRDKSFLSSMALGIGMIALFIAAFVFVFIYSSITVIISFLLPITAGLCYYNKFTISKKLKKDILVAAIFGGVICIVIYFSQHTKIEAQIQSIFFDGHILKKEVLVESDGEVAEHYEDRYKFILNEDVSYETLALIKYFQLLGIGGGLFLSFYFFAKSNPLKDDDDNEVESTFFIVVRLIVATGLILCLLDMPHWYYNTIRWIVPLGCIYLAQSEFLQNRIWGYIFFVLVGILFNPFDRIESNRLVWNVIDICLSVIMVAWAVKDYIDKKSEET